MGIGQILKGHDLFGLLSVEDMNLVSGFSSVKTLSAGESIFQFNALSTHVYVLMKGSVHLRLPSDDPDVSFLVHKLKTGEFFGLAPLLGQDRYTTTAYCTSAVQVLAIEAEPFRELLQHDYAVGYQVMREAARIYYSRYLGVIRSLQGVISQIPLER